MNEIWKFPVPLADWIKVSMPQGAEILHFDEQKGELFIWARVDPTAPTELRAFRFAGTGHPLDQSVGRHVGTVKLSDGALIFHLFELA